MKLLAVLLAAFICAVLLHEFVPDHSFIRIAFGNHIIEANLWVMLGLVIGAGILLWLAVQLIKLIFGSQNPLNFWSKKSTQKRAVSKTKRGLIALVEGDWNHAKKLLSAAAPKADTELLNYLGAARAAAESGDEKEASNLLQKAYETSPDAEFAIGITQAQVQLSLSQLEPCLATLIRLRKERPSHKLVLKLLKVVYTKLEDWQQLTQLITSLRKNRVFKLDELETLEQAAWTHLIQQKSEEFNRLENADERSDAMTKLWDQAPNSLRENDQFLYLYCQTLATLGDGAQAETLLRKVLKREWSDHLVELYGKISGQSTSEQLITAESWLKERPNNAVLLLSLGRLSLRNELWGKALEYFEASHNQSPNQETFSELCRLAPLIKNDPNQQADLMKGLVGTISLPNLPLPKATR